MTEEEKRRFFAKVDKMTDGEAIEIYKKLDERGKGSVKTMILSNWECMVEGRMEALRDGEKATEKRTR